MDEREFDALATQTLQRIERALDESGIDADFELKEGGVLELEFDNRSKIIVNGHVAAREIWVAARAGGFHFRWDGSAWRDARGGGAADRGVPTAPCQCGRSRSAMPRRCRSGPCRGP